MIFSIKEKIKNSSVVQAVPFDSEILTTGKSESDQTDFTSSIVNQG